jgi:hypothetical protein
LDARVTAAFRTPEKRFEGLPEFAYEPHYRFVGDLRLAHLDVGEGPPVVMLHGEPAWSFVWRKVIPPLRFAVGCPFLSPETRVRIPVAVPRFAGVSRDAIHRGGRTANRLQTLDTPDRIHEELEAMASGFSQAMDRH